MSAGVPEKIKDFVWQIILAIVIIAGGLGWTILLQTVARAYYIESEAPVGTDKIARTYLVLNPGPWKERKPTIEFPVSSSGTIIAQSPGTITEMNSGRLLISPREMLPPGCAFFAVYEFNRTSNVPAEASVLCDGKPCKREASFDMDMIMKLHQAGGLICIGVCLISLLAVVNIRLELNRERAHTIRHATEILLANSSRFDNEAVRASSETIETVQSNARQLQIQAKPKAVTNRRRTSAR